MASSPAASASVTRAARFVNQATIIQAGAGSLTVYDSVQIDNAATGTYDITGNGGFVIGNDAPFIINSGLFEKTGGTGTTTIAASVRQPGRHGRGRRRAPEPGRWRHEHRRHL